MKDSSSTEVTPPQTTGPAYVFDPVWRTTKTHSIEAMMDCYRLIYFAFTQPRVVSSFSPISGGTESASPIPGLNTRSGLDALYTRHMNINKKRANSSSSTSPLASLPILCGTVYDAHGDDSSLMAHVPPAFVEDLFKRVVGGGGAGGDDDEEMIQQLRRGGSNSSSTGEESPIEIIHFDSERGVGYVLFRNGFMGEQCYLAHHLSTYSMPTKAALRRGISEGASLTDTKGVPTTVPVTLFLEYAYCLPFVNPCLLQLHKDAGTLSRHMFRTFPMPFESEAAAEQGRCVGGRGGGQTFSKKRGGDGEIPLCAVKNGKKIFASSSHTCVKTDNKQSSALLHQQSQAAPSLSNNATLLKESRWVSTSKMVNTNTISLPHNEHWYHGIPALSAPSSGEFIIAQILRNPVIPQALVEVVLGMDSGALEVDALKTLCRSNSNLDDSNKIVSNSQSSLKSSTPPSMSVLDLWVGYVCQYVLWKPTQIDDDDHGTKAAEDGNNSEDQVLGTTEADEESKKARSFYTNLLRGLSHQATAVQTITAQALVYLAASEALAILDYNNRNNEKGGTANTAVSSSFLPNSITAMILRTSGAQRGEEEEDPLRQVIHLLQHTSSLITGSTSDGSGNPCLEHLHTNFVVPFQKQQKNKTSKHKTVADKASVVIVCEMLREYIADPLRHSVVAFVNFKQRLQLDPSLALFTADVKIQVARRLRLEKALELTSKLQEVLEEKVEENKASEADFAAIQAYVAEQLNKLLTSNRGDDVDVSKSDKSATTGLTGYYRQKSREVLGVDLVEGGKVPQLPFFAEEGDVIQFLVGTSPISLAFNVATNAEVLRREGLLQTGNKEDDEVYINDEPSTSTSDTSSKAQKTVFRDPLDTFSQVALLFDKHASSGSSASMAMITCPPSEFFFSPDSTPTSTTKKAEAPKTQPNGGGEDNGGESVASTPTSSYAGLGGRLRAEARRYQGPLGVAKLLGELFWELARIPLMVLTGFTLIAMFAVYMFPGGDGGQFIHDPRSDVLNFQNKGTE